ncbi:MarR family transcriptional regulator [Candidatus Woesearchaeota archaeon]|nr:MarR family transcriptional regulator [Candidatus Woesearchaeota archaeon]
MDNKKLGIIILIIGIILASVVYIIKIREDYVINKIIEQEGSCFLDDGFCLHADRNTTFYIIGWIVSATIIALGIYLLFFEKSQKVIISTLEKQKKIQTQEEKFDILLKGLTEDEKKVIKAVKEQDGITQQTLRLRTDLHKSKLSIILDGLEKKGLITRKEKGKTKQVFLKINL